jgi:hypothetical protein
MLNGNPREAENIQDPRDLLDAGFNAVKHKTVSLSNNNIFCITRALCCDTDPHTVGVRHPLYPNNRKPYNLEPTGSGVLF